jgi:hypothetical protein
MRSDGSFVSLAPSSSLRILSILQRQNKLSLVARVPWVITVSPYTRCNAAGAHPCLIEAIILWSSTTSASAVGLTPVGAHDT